MMSCQFVPVNSQIDKDTAIGVFVCVNWVEWLHPITSV